MNIKIAPILIALGLILTTQSLISCSPSHIINKHSDIKLLPENEGVSGGSFVAVTNWQYRGSDSGYHYFWHFHNKGNHLRKRTVRIPQSLVKLDFPSRTVSDSETWMMLKRDHTSKLHFVYLPMKKRHFDLAGE